MLEDNPYHCSHWKYDDERYIEQVGTYDSFPNDKNECLVGLNLERLKYWIGQGAQMDTVVGEILGLSGFLPIHPETYIKSWRNRYAMRGQEEDLKLKPEEMPPFEKATKPVLGDYDKFYDDSLMPDVDKLEAFFGPKKEKFSYKEDYKLY